MSRASTLLARAPELPKLLMQFPPDVEPEEEPPVKVKRSLSIGSSRYIDVDSEKQVAVRDETNIVKHAVFSAVRLVKFCEQISNIDAAIERAITLKLTNYRCHIGGNWHITVNDEMPFVDIRRWYWRSDENALRPSQVGIALTFVQWNNLKTVIDEIKDEFEDVESCWHLSQRDVERCRECTPSSGVSR